MSDQDEMKSAAAESNGNKVKATLELEGFSSAIDASGTGKAKDAEKEEPAPIVTEHSILVNGEPLEYTVTTGRMPLRDENGVVEAFVFFMAYNIKVDPASPKRPLIFSFNGGPGSASVWLHLGAVGPKRVRMMPDGQMPAPPFVLEDNPLTWLEHADLVFIDPVGTGFSRPAKPELGKKFWSLKGDISSIGEFITRYLTKYQRWTSPLFLVGESYGTTRAAGLAGYLIDHGVAFNGIMLVSSILQFQTALFAHGNDLPYVLFLPTYTATAWYHKQLEADLQKSLADTLAEVEAWAAGEYASALAKGDKLVGEERAEIERKLARYTGLSLRYIADSDIRVPIFRFCKELLRDEKQTVGRLDTRFKGIDATPVSEYPDFDPSMSAIRPPYTATFNDYVRTKLGYETDLQYHILGGGINSKWEWNSDNSFAETGDALRGAMARNPHMRILVASGYYDLATPYFATDYTLSHMGLAPSQTANITTTFYEAGHMMYIDVKELERLKTDVASFIDSTLAAHLG